ncbi:hypothetical protein BD311DRAFT_24437 [Dichomitus squalens]|uniref:Uncharacterized protein n=1 Tax=Dichomitus squalens TaxID=114155 RepID=A0A4Q9MW76_9APHY|nr:hypothetical protein BD311DRAFT_24437 [Dichomitus squalens]
MTHSYPADPALNCRPQNPPPLDCIPSKSISNWPNREHTPTKPSTHRKFVFTLQGDVHSASTPLPPPTILRSRSAHTTPPASRQPRLLRIHPPAAPRQEDSLPGHLRPVILRARL